jgi:hypothetical protein
MRCGIWEGIGQGSSLREPARLARRGVDGRLTWQRSGVKLISDLRLLTSVIDDFYDLNLYS